MPASTPIQISTHDALRRAVDLVGSQAAVARLLGVSQPSVWKWLAKKKPLPAEHVLAIEAATGVPKEQLRPDIYRPEDTTGQPAVPVGKMEGAR